MPATMMAPNISTKTPRCSTTRRSPKSADFAATRRYAPAATLATLGQAKATYGPFSVIDGATVRMAGDVTAATPRQFAAMLAAYPGLKRLEMVDCPGSLDEEANLILARAIRRAGTGNRRPERRFGAVGCGRAVARRDHPPRRA